MADSESRLFCRLDGFTQATREQQRFKALVELGILKPETIPVFEEATQTAARFLDMPICILSLMAQDRQWIKSAVGLSTVGLMNDLANSRQLPRSESFCAYVVDSHQALAIEDVGTEAIFAKSLLFQQYGVRAYLGAPLLTTSGYCLGTLAVMSLVPRTFTTKDIDFLAIVTRWVISEVERNRLIKEQHTNIAMDGLSRPYARKSKAKNGSWQIPGISSRSYASSSNREEETTAYDPSAQAIKIKLLTHLSDELRTPLTSVMGMTSVLRREIYGPLGRKQKEYLDIIHSSGQQLISLVDEISALGTLEDNSQKLQKTVVNIEMLSQQAIKSLEEVAAHRQQQIRLSIELENRLWVLDKDKLRLMLYYLMFNAIESVEVGCLIRVHVYYKDQALNIAVWASRPWLDDWFSRVEVEPQAVVSATTVSPLSQEREVDPKFQVSEIQPEFPELPSVSQPLSVSYLLAVLTSEEETPGVSYTRHSHRQGLGLLLGCQLAEIHGGQILVQGSTELGYRYVVTLPHVEPADEKI